MNNDSNKTKSAVKKLLADHLGIETEDIGDEDFLRDDLHMTPAEISDFIHLVEQKYGFDFEDISSIESFQDLTDEISQNLDP